MSFKRQAETDLNQDNVHDMDKEVSDKAKHDTWKRAPDSVLASRKILKVSEGFLSAKTKESAPTTTAPATATAPAGGGGFAAYAKINPFAAMGPPTGFSSTANKSAFPSKTVSIPSVPAPSSAPKVSNSPKTNPFGATNPAHNPFMNFVEQNKPNVDYWQKFKEPIKVSTSDSVSSSDVKVTFVNPSSTTPKNPTGSETSSPTSTVTSPAGSNAGSYSNNDDVVKDKDNNGVDSSTVTDNTSEETKATESNSNEEKGDAAPSSALGEKKPSIDTAAMFSKPAELDNGEAGEECVLKLRTKLYRLSDVEKSASKEWVEVGTGPTRLLTPSASLSTGASLTSEGPLYPRIVMRREHQAGGPGTKVILNTSFRSRFSVAKMGERAARLTCLAVPPEAPKSISLDEIGTTPSTSSTEVLKEEDDDDIKPKAVPMTFLFKMQHSHEADQFIKHINGFLQQSEKEDAKE